MPLSEESDPSGKRQKQPCTGATTAAKRPGRPTHNAPPPWPFSFCPARPGPLIPRRLQRPAPTAHHLPGLPTPGPLHTMPAPHRLPYASIQQQPAATYCTACTLPAMQQPAPPATLPRLPHDHAAPGLLWADRWPAGPARLPDRRRAGAARPAAPPLAMTPRPPPGAGPMMPPPRPRARRYWERRSNPLRVRKPKNFLGIKGFLPFPERGPEKI